jgi:hypothetical protein
MGLDMYAYVGARGQYNAFYEGCNFDKESGELVNPKVSKPRELAYWRKHPNLHGWMEQLWSKRRAVDPSIDGETFNNVELELTWEDLDQLEKAILAGGLPPTSGFFFGNDSDEYYREQDLEFIKNARAELFCGLKVFYNSSW